jgi:alanine dehydrogenase
MTLLLSDSDVRAVCDIGAMVQYLNDAMRAEAKGAGPLLPERMNLAQNGTFLRVMPAVLPQAGLMGLKFFHGSQEKGVRYLVALCSIDSGAIIAVLDAAFLTAARTGATSGVATHWMSRGDSTTVGVIGSGLEAETNVRALCSVRPISRVTVYSRSPERRSLFAARMADSLGIDVVPAREPEQAVRGADIVLVATNTGPEQVVAYRGQWLERGQHVVSIGSTMTVLREIDAATVLGADAVVFDTTLDQLSRESGDIIDTLRVQPGWRGGVLLSEVLAGDHIPRSNADDITLFKSVGNASQDLLAAAYLVQEARRRGVGTEVDELATLKLF